MKIEIYKIKNQLKYEVIMENKSFEDLEKEKQERLEKIAQDNCILRVVAGSHAYGTNLLVIGTKEVYL